MADTDLENFAYWYHNFVSGPSFTSGEVPLVLSLSPFSFAKPSLWGTVCMFVACNLCDACFSLMLGPCGSVSADGHGTQCCWTGSLIEHDNHWALRTRRLYLDLAQYCACARRIWVHGWQDCLVPTPPVSQHAWWLQTAHLLAWILAWCTSVAAQAISSSQASSHLLQCVYNVLYLGDMTHEVQEQAHGIHSTVCQQNLQHVHKHMSC